MLKGFVLVSLVYSSLLWASPSPAVNTASAEFLYWTLQEGGADNWGQYINPKGPNFLQSQQAIQILDTPFTWSPGFRLGLSHALANPSQDIAIYYTRFLTTANKTVAPGSGAIYSAFLGNFYVNNTDGSGLSGPIYGSGQLQWKTLINTVDLQLGQGAVIDQWFNYRVFLGLKLAFADQTIHTQWFNPTAPAFPYTPLDFTQANEDLSQDFGGAGPSIGMHALFPLRGQLKLVGDISGALLWGRWRFSDVYHNDAGRRVSIQSPSIHHGSSILTGMIGLEWQLKQAQLLLGYESQIWGNQVQYYLFNGGRLANLMSLQGAVARINYAFG